MATDRAAGPPRQRPELGGLLRAWRKRALLTQEQLAQRTGLSVRTISRLEAGGLRPRSESVRLLAGALGLSHAEQALLVGQAAPVSTQPPLSTASIPRQLPADVVGFTGRGAQLAELDRLLVAAGADAVVITAITGAGGVGKTALAIHCQWPTRNLCRIAAAQHRRAQTALPGARPATGGGCGGGPSLPRRYRPHPTAWRRPLSELNERGQARISGITWRLGAAAKLFVLEAATTGTSGVVLGALLWSSSVHNG